jgi:hypothetical protein
MIAMEFNLKNADLILEKEKFKIFNVRHIQKYLYSLMSQTHIMCLIKEWKIRTEKIWSQIG